MTRFEKLMEQMLTDDKQSRRLFALDRLYIEFIADFDKVAEAVLQKGNGRLKFNVAYLLSERKDPRADKLMAEYLEKELAAKSNDTSHWDTLCNYLDFYVKRQDALMVERFFPFVNSDERLGASIILAIKELKIAIGIPLLIKAAAAKDEVFNTDEHAMIALGDFGGEEAIAPLTKISKTGGAARKRAAKDALDKIAKRLQVKV
jgi:HEAT repeat protein